MQSEVLPELCHLFLTEMKNKPLAEIVIFLASLIVYILTICPDVYVGDSGEFISNAFTLGYNHTPGYPLHILISRIAILILPFLSVPLTVNLVSAAAASLSSVFVYKILKLINLDSIIGISLSLMWSFSFTLWSRATIAEIYTLNILFVSVVTYFVLKFYYKQSLTNLYFAAFWSGLGLSQHINGALFVLSAVLLVVLVNRKTLFQISVMKYVIMFFAIGVSIYVYLIIRSASNEALPFSGPEKWKRLSEYILPGVGITKQLFKTGGGMANFAERALWFLKSLFVKEFWIFGFLFIPGIWAIRKEWKLLLFFGSAAFINSFNTVRGPLQFQADFDAHFLVTYLMALILMGFGVRYFLEIASKKFSKFPRTIPSFLIFPIVVLLLNFNDNDKSKNDFGSILLENLVVNLEQNAALFTAEDEEFFLTRYLQQVEGKRSDLTIVTNSDLGKIIKASGRIPAVSNNQQMQMLLMRTAKSLIDKYIKIRPVYITMEHFPVENIWSEYNLIPQGIVSRVLPKDSEYDTGLKDVLVNPAWSNIHLDARVRGMAEYSYLSQFLYNSDIWNRLGIHENVVGEIERFRNFPIETQDENKRRLTFVFEGRANLYLKNYEKAVAALTEAIERKEDDWISRELRGTAFLMMSDTSNARNDWHLSLKYNPNNPGLNEKLSSLFNSDK